MLRSLATKTITSCSLSQTSTTYGCSQRRWRSESVTFFFKLVRETCHRSRTHRPGRLHKIKRLVFQVVWVDNPRAQLWICHRTHLQFHHACALERKAHVFLVFVEKGARTVEFECVETMESVAAPCCLCVADCVSLYEPVTVYQLQTQYLTKLTPASFSLYGGGVGSEVLFFWDANFFTGGSHVSSMRDRNPTTVPIHSPGPV